MRAMSKALTTLPAPLVDSRKGYQGEKVMLYGTFPYLQDIETKPLTHRQQQEMIQAAKYFMGMAHLAEKQGSKLDALTYYQRAIAANRANSTERAHALWNELGGTNEGWLIYSNPPSGATVAPGSTTPRVTSRAQIGKPLPALSLKDFGAPR